MPEYIIRPKNKKEEKVIEAFLSSLQINYHTEAQEDAALFEVMQKDRKTPLLNKAQKEDFITSLRSPK